MSTSNLLPDPYAQLPDAFTDAIAKAARQCKRRGDSQLDGPDALRGDLECYEEDILDQLAVPIAELDLECQHLFEDIRTAILLYHDGMSVEAQRVLRQAVERSPDRA